MGIDFWENQASEHGFAVKAVNFDPIEEELEFFYLNDLFSNGDVVCDIGCGNGRTIFELAKNNPKSVFYGVDSSENMIKVANNRKKELSLDNVFFSVFDAGSQSLSDLFEIKFDKILTKRLLINVKGNAKHQTIDSIKSMLKDDGVYIMVECFVEPLARINKARNLLDLSTIEVKHFNEYLTEEFLDFVKTKFEVVEKKDFEGLYYFISRVFNAVLSEGAPDYNAKINKLSAELIKGGINPIQGYAPEVMYLLKKK